eukprot:jgi/Galph1/5441/GphlegSOOS_G4052.1
MDGGVSTQLGLFNLPKGIAVKTVTKENVAQSLDDFFTCIQRSTFITVKVVHSCSNNSLPDEDETVGVDGQIETSSTTSVNTTETTFKYSFVSEALGQKTVGSEKEESKNKEHYTRLKRIASGETILEVLVSSFRRKPPKEYVPGELEIETNADNNKNKSFPFSVFHHAHYSVRVFRFLFLRNGQFLISSDNSIPGKDYGDLSDYFQQGISYSVPKEETHTPGDSLKGQNYFRQRFNSSSVFGHGWSEILPPAIAQGEGAVLLRFIAESRVPLVVHDGLLDLMALYHAFHAPLPSSLESFLAQLSLLLPRIYDLRCLVEDALELDGSNIQTIYQTLYEPAFLEELHTKLKHSSKFQIQPHSYYYNLNQGGKMKTFNQTSDEWHSKEDEEFGDLMEDDDNNVKLLQQRIDALLEDNISSPTASTHGGMLFRPLSCHFPENSVKEKKDATLSAESLERYPEVTDHSIKHWNPMEKKWHSVHAGCLFDSLTTFTESDAVSSSEGRRMNKETIQNAVSYDCSAAFQIGSIFATLIEIFGWSQVVSRFERKIFQSPNQPWLVLPSGFVPLPKPDLSFQSVDDLLGSLESSWASSSLHVKSLNASSWDGLYHGGISTLYSSSVSLPVSAESDRKQHSEPFLNTEYSSMPRSRSNQNIIPSLQFGNNNIRSDYLSRLGLFHGHSRTERTEDAICVRINRFLDVCVPTSFSELRREAVFRVVASIIKRSIGAQAFCYGSFATKTYHADSVLEIGAFLVGKNDNVEWSAKLMAALCEDATRASDYHSSPAEFSYISLIEQQYPVPLPVRNISFIRPKPTPTGCQLPAFVTFTVNWPIEDPRSGLVALDTNSTERDIAPNVRVSVTLNHVSGVHATCILEEFDHALGRNHLFKRSLLLVRAWIDYGVKLTDTFPSRAVEILVVFVANCFHATIETPFDLLNQFFSYFVHFDWKNFGVCEKGIVDLATGQILQPVACTEYLFPPGTEALLYHRSFRQIEDLREAMEKFEIVSSEVLNVFDHINNNIYRNVCVDTSEKDLVSLQKAFNKGLRDAELFHSAPTAANLLAMTGSAWKRHIDRWKLIDTQLAVLIDRSLSAPVTQQVAGKKFNHALSSDDTRPLLYISSAGFLDYFYEKDPLFVDMTTLRNNLEYVRFIVNSEVTELGLLAFLTQILAENGCLLIGEIGQHLRSTFGKQDWSSILKERFGGLKRFLLKHSELFYVDNDHPLNPHIYLRKSINGPLYEKKSVALNSNMEPCMNKKEGKSKKNKKQAMNGNNEWIRDSGNEANSSSATPTKPMFHLSEKETHQKTQQNFATVPSSALRYSGNLYVPQPQAHMQSGMVTLNSSDGSFLSPLVVNSYASNTLAASTEEEHANIFPLYLQPSSELQVSPTFKYKTGENDQLQTRTSLSLTHNNEIEKAAQNLQGEPLVSGTGSRTLPSSFDYGFGPSNSF